MPLKRRVRSRILAKLIFIGLCGLVLIFFTISISQADWYIDEQRFLGSVHKDVSCQDCHTEIIEEEHHPNPANVKKDITDFFSPDMCYECHDEVSDDIGAGIHGSQDGNKVRNLEQCFACHDYHYEGALETASEADHTVEEFDEDCMACHRQVALDDPGRVAKIRTVCFACHAPPKSLISDAAQIDPVSYEKTPHAAIDCLACHPDAAGYHHDRQTSAECQACHYRHQESVAHDAHLSVACQACHLSDVVPLRNGWDVNWTRASAAGQYTRIHEYIQAGESSCARCHYAGTNIGAAAIILPPKSIACMPCHAATLTVGDTVTLAALLIFLIGIIGMIAIWFSASRPGFGGGGFFSTVERTATTAIRTLKTTPWARVTKTILYDVFLQRRLFRRSILRWLIHGLIFFPMMIRFLWGIAALFATNELKRFPAVWLLVDKNHPLTAVLFDATGIMIIIGVAGAWLRGRKVRELRPADLPGQDRLALALIGGIVVVGFFLEGLRIAMTGTPPNANFAFIGILISRMFSDIKGMGDVYGVIWYAHAVLTGMFIAYLPFSRLIHIVLAPLTMILNTVAHGHAKTKAW